MMNWTVLVAIRRGAGGSHPACPPWLASPRHRGCLPRPLTGVGARRGLVQQLLEEGVDLVVGLLQAIRRWRLPEDNGLDGVLDDLGDLVAVVADGQEEGAAGS